MSLQIPGDTADPNAVATEEIWSMSRIDIVSLLTLQARARRNALATSRELSRRRRESAAATAALSQATASHPRQRRR